MRLIAPAFLTLSAVFAAIVSFPSGGLAHEPNPGMTKADVDRLMTELSNWGRWGKNDQLGAANLITAAKSRQAVALVREGFTVSLAHDTDKEKAGDNQYPYEHTMVAVGLAGQWNVDRFQVLFHGYQHTHMDALCHMFWNGKMLIALGVHIFDNCDLEALSDAAAKRGRWEFMLTAAPIPLTGGTGSPLNPIATF